MWRVSTRCSSMDTLSVVYPQISHDALAIASAKSRPHISEQVEGIEYLVEPEIRPCQTPLRATFARYESPPGSVRPPSPRAQRRYEHRERFVRLQVRVRRVVETRSRQIPARTHRQTPWLYAAAKIICEVPSRLRTACCLSS